MLILVAHRNSVARNLMLVGASMIKEGKKVPKVNLKTQADKSWKISKKNKYTVIYFYPKDDTPGCTLEGIEFTKALPAFKSLNTEVVGVSGGTTLSKEKFCKKHTLKVTLLSDEDFSVSKAFGAYGEKSFMGRKYFGIHRYTFVVDSQEKIVKIFTNVKPAEHIEEVLNFIRGLKKLQSKKVPSKTSLAKNAKTVSPPKSKKNAQR